MITFGTKAETLLSLEGYLKSAQILPQICFSVKQWYKSGCTLDVIGVRPDWFNSSVIVRSSSQAEDTSFESKAGCFSSVLDVVGDEQLTKAINTVVLSLESNNSEDQIFIQPMLINVKVSGVGFTCDPNSASHYYIINFDDQSGKTDSVTNGSSNELKTFYIAKGSYLPQDNLLYGVLQLLQELESLFQNERLDVEFAVDANGTLVLLQVRPLVIKSKNRINKNLQRKILTEIENRFCSLSQAHPYLLGQKAVYGVMPDWNPAEIIGIRPRTLALSLYKELVTDSIWAYQRDNYGYRNLRSFPLLVSFAGLPYIDIRVSFNSFIPSDLDESLAERLVNHYMKRLLQNPNYHDKVEFEIIYSCYTLDLPTRLTELDRFGFRSEECEQIADSLRNLTNDIIHGKDGLWRKDIEKINELRYRQELILNSNLSPVERIYWLLEDCKRYGTLPFAGLARAGFIAVQLLKSLVRVGVLSEIEYERFMGSLDTVNSNMHNDLKQLSHEGFLSKYGHLRPGTYNILSPRYDEEPELYFDWDKIKKDENIKLQDKFTLGLDTLNNLESLLCEHRLEHDVLSLFNFIKGAIEGREYAKFIFTKSLSDVMVLVNKLGNEHGISKDELSYLNIDVFKQLYSTSDNIDEVLRKSIETGQRAHARTQAITLPILITKPEDIWFFELSKNEPNYITLLIVKGRVAIESCPNEQLKDSIFMITSADPGYDWIFSHCIGGFITMFGGSNSHMAIRAGELGIPAVIGAGELLFKQWSKAKLLEVDCANKQVRILQ